MAVDDMIGTISSRQNGAAVDSKLKGGAKKRRRLVQPEREMNLAVDRTSKISGMVNN